MPIASRRSACIALLALPTLIPIVAAAVSWLNAGSAHRGHVLRVVLPDVVGTTAALIAIVAIAACALGTGLGWLIARYRFPGHGIWRVALLIPLAMPGYVLGFLVIGAFDYSGPIQSQLRDVTGATESFWNVRGLAGAAVTLALTLYPYVFLISQQAFSNLGASSFEVAEALGQRRRFWRVALPMCAPAIGGATLLVVMETLADFGTVALFNVETFTTAIYASWFDLFSIDLALQLATVLLVLAFVLVSLHGRLQRPSRQVQDVGRSMPAVRLTGWRAWAASAAVGSFIFFVVVGPLITLAVWSAQHITAEWDARYLGWLWHSLVLALGAAALLCGGALSLAYLGRGAHGRWAVALTRVATVGYAMPGALLAVGLFAAFAALERSMAAWIAPGWVTQSLVLVLIGYFARFLTVAYTPVAQQMHRLTQSLDEAARGMGVRGLALIGRVHVPLLASALGTAAALVMIDVLKEMPITLMTRPLGWDTLATRVFELTAEGEYRRAALPSLTIVLAGLLPVALALRAGAGHRSSGPDSTGAVRAA